MKSDMVLQDECATAKMVADYERFIQQVWDALDCKGAGGGVDYPDDPLSTNQVVLRRIREMVKNECPLCGRPFEHCPEMAMNLDPDKMVVDESRSNPLAVAMTYPDCPLNPKGVCFYMAIDFGVSAGDCEFLKEDGETAECTK